MDTRTVTFTTHAEPNVGNLVDGIEKQHDISETLVRVEMTDAEFNAMMQDGLSAAKADIPALCPKSLQICVENSVYEWAARIFERLQKS